MDVFEIRGGRSLHGETRVYGAKNAALPILAATVMVDGKSVIEDVPQLEDVRVMLNILQILGAKVTWKTQTSVEVDATKINNTNVPSELMQRMRSPMLRY